jgi:hypothetical protein
MTPTARSLAYLREQGWHAEVVEMTIRAPGRTFKRDLWGWCDILCVGPDGALLAVQTTSATNVAARVRKIGDSPLLPLVRAAGVAIHVHGWAKRNSRWTLRIEDVS